MTRRIPASSRRRRSRPAIDNAIILYTSGTTGKPKGVMPDPRRAADRGRQRRRRLRQADRPENMLSYLPMAWVGDCLFSFAQAHVAGFTVNCPESSDTVMTDLREIGPTYYFRARRASSRTC
jgi:long-chain acyl-CoA synthetase